MNIEKRVPANMVSEYLAKGWIVGVREGRTVLLLWTKMENPP